VTAPAKLHGIAKKALHEKQAAENFRSLFGV
jgi:hypothetical protein